MPGRGISSLEEEGESRWFVSIDRNRVKRGEGRGRIGRREANESFVKICARKGGVRRLLSPREKERIPYGGFFARNFDPSGIPSGFHPWKGLKIFA